MVGKIIRWYIRIIIIYRFCEMVFHFLKLAYS